MEHQSESVLEIVQDPLLREVEFPHARTYFPYGIPLLVRTNSTAVLEATQQSWGHFPQMFDTPPLELHVGVAGSSEGDPPPNPVYRTRRHLLTTTGDAEHFAVSDFESGYGLCWITPRLLRDDLAALRFFYLEAAGYSLVTERYLAPVHGACVSWNGRGVLLCGQSQAGKSTLAYACARRGFAYVSDDGSFLVRSARDRRVIGNSRSIRFRPPSVVLFPELDRFVAQPRANGKIAIEVGTTELGLPAIASEGTIDAIVFLNRQSGVRAASLAGFSRSAAMAQFEESLRFGRDGSIAEQRESLRRMVSEVNVFEMIYSDLDMTVDRLQNLLETGN